jgi:dTDP-4-dehydrorhamnose 3,5-epimerase
MAKFKRIETGISGLVVIEPTVFGDHRGFFMETYNRREFEAIGITATFVQDNQSRSMRGVLRGLHFQTRRPQGKLVRVVKGAVWDVAVDLRAGSATFGQWYGLELSEENKRMLYVPEGFAHGFLTLEDGTEFVYKCTDYYAPEYEAGLFYRDARIGVRWPFREYGINEEEIVLSAKDASLPTFEAVFGADGERLDAKGERPEANGGEDR